MLVNRDVFAIQNDMFEIIEGLHYCLQVKNKEDYKLYLIAMDELNEEHKTLVGNYYIDPLRALGYYEKLWKDFYDKTT